LANAKKIVELLSMRLCNVAMVAMFFLMCFTTADVLIRKFVPGGTSAMDIFKDSDYVTNFSLVVVIFCGFAYLETQHGHIRVDILINLFPRVPKKILEGLMPIIGAIVLFFLAYAFFSTIGNTMAANKVSVNLHIPQWPFELIAGVSMLFYGIAVLFNGIVHLAEKKKAIEEPEACSTEG